MTEQEEIETVRRICDLYRCLGFERSPAWVRREAKLITRRRGCTIANAYEAMEERLVTDGDWPGNLQDAA